MLLLLFLLTLSIDATLYIVHHFLQSVFSRYFNKILPFYWHNIKADKAFLEVLDAARIRCVWDIRLWRVSKHVPYYSGENLATVLGDRYEYHPEFAPEFEMLTAFKDKKATWADSEPIYRRLIAGRTPLAGRSPDELDRICLMCTEKTAHQCHRRLAAEYIASQFPDAEIVHL